jgi:DNA-directed RNA polymerase subunit RPC12/RpoP
MPVHFRCTKCNTRLGVSTQKKDAQIRCPKCGEFLVVPRASDAVTAGPSSIGVGAAKGHARAVPAPNSGTVAEKLAAARLRQYLIVGGAAAAAALVALFLVITAGVVVWLATRPAASASGPMAKTPTFPEFRNEATKPSSGGEKTLPPKEVGQPPAKKEPMPVTDPGALPSEDPAAGGLSLRFNALGSATRLAKLKAVRLVTKSTFASATNINDIHLMWCWEPKITFRMDENFRDADLNKVLKQLKGTGKNQQQVMRQIMETAKAGFELDTNLSRRFDDECNILIKRGEYKPLFDTVLLIEGNEAYRILNNRVSVPLKSKQATQMRNLSFALSVSNLIPLKLHKFPVESEKEAIVKNKPCDQFRVSDPDGLKLQFFFDKETNLLSKIAHMGHNPRGGGGTIAAAKETYWEHYFSDYRETEGIKQWRKLEVHNDGRLFATLAVSEVHFYDELRSELRRPDLAVTAAK